jgi:hypothetical protein
VYHEDTTPSGSLLSPYTAAAAAATHSYFDLQVNGPNCHNALDMAGIFTPVMKGMWKIRHQQLVPAEGPKISE